MNSAWVVKEAFQRKRCLNWILKNSYEFTHEKDGMNMGGTLESDIETGDSTETGGNQSPQS